MTVGAASARCSSTRVAHPISFEFSRAFESSSGVLRSTFYYRTAALGPLLRERFLTLLETVYLRRAETDVKALGSKFPHYRQLLCLRLTAAITRHVFSVTNKTELKENLERGMYKRFSFQIR